MTNKTNRELKLLTLIDTVQSKYAEVVGEVLDNGELDFDSKVKLRATVTSAYSLITEVLDELDDTAA